MKKKNKLKGSILGNIFLIGTNIEMSTTNSMPVLPITIPYNNDNYNSNVLQEVNNVNRNLVSEICGVKSDLCDVNRDINSGVCDLKSDGSRNTASIVDNITARSNADYTNLRSNQQDTRQSVERNADFIKNSIQSSANQVNSNVDDAHVDISNQINTTHTAILRDLGLNSIQNERIAGEIRATQADFARQQLLESKQIQITQARDFGLSQKDSCENTSKLMEKLAFQDLEACKNKNHLENLINQRSNESMAKLAECCCELRLDNRTTQTLIKETACNSDIARLQSELAASKQEALIARLCGKETGKS